MTSSRNRITLFLLSSLVTVGLFAHGGGHVRGTVQSVGSRSLVVHPEEGSDRTFSLEPDTVVLVGATRSTLAEVKPGRRVVIHLAADGHVSEVHVAATPVK